MIFMIALLRHQTPISLVWSHHYNLSSLYKCYLYYIVFVDTQYVIYKYTVCFGLFF
jgi:hypothetical protein